MKSATATSRQRIHETYCVRPWKKKTEILVSKATTTREGGWMKEKIPRNNTADLTRSG